MKPEVWKIQNSRARASVKNTMDRFTFQDVIKAFEKLK